jgi:hypothetical protein
VTFLLPLWAWARQQEIDWAWLGILTLPLTLQSLNNGQVNPLVAGLLLSTLIAFASERWTWAAAFVSLAFLLKGYPLALGLLLMLLEPWRFGPRLLVMVVLGLAIPFALQSPAYVVEQYNDWLARLGVDDRSAWPAYAGYQDFALLLRVSVGPCPRSLAHALGLAAAFACAVAVLGLRWRGLDRQRLVLACGDLAIGWMLLFGPATETCTYTLLAAPLALRLRAGRPSAWLAYGLLLSALMALWFPKEFSRPVLSLGVQPLGALIYLGGVVVESWSAPVAGVRSSRQLGA